MEGLLTCKHLQYTVGQLCSGGVLFRVVDGDQGLRYVPGPTSSELLAQVAESPVVRGQFDVFGAGLRVQALAQRQLAVRHQTDCRTRRVDGERANVRVELKGGEREKENH